LTQERDCWRADSRQSPHRRSNSGSDSFGAVINGLI